MGGAVKLPSVQGRCGDQVVADRHLGAAMPRNRCIDGGDNGFSLAALIPPQISTLLRHAIVWFSNMAANNALSTLQGSLA